MELYYIAAHPAFIVLLYYSTCPFVYEWYSEVFKWAVCKKLGGSRKNCWWTQYFLPSAHMPESRTVTSLFGNRNAINLAVVGEGGMVNVRFLKPSGINGTNVFFNSLICEWNTWTANDCKYLPETIANTAWSTDHLRCSTLHAGVLSTLNSIVWFFFSSVRGFQ